MFFELEMDFPGTSDGKEFVSNAGDLQDTWV